jgi:hypothetical protein
MRLLADSLDLQRRDHRRRSQAGFVEPVQNVKALVSHEYG